MIVKTKEITLKLTLKGDTQKEVDGAFAQIHDQLFWLSRRRYFVYKGRGRFTSRVHVVKGSIHD